MNLYKKKYDIQLLSMHHQPRLMGRLGTTGHRNTRNEVTVIFTSQPFQN